MGLSSLAWVGPNNLYRAWPNNIGGVEPTKNIRRDDLDLEVFSVEIKMNHFFSWECLFCIHKTIVDWFQGVLDIRLTWTFLSNNFQWIINHKRFVESKLENKVFKKDFEHENMF